MSTLVLGATGRIGGATLAALADAGHAPLALVRSPERAKSLCRDVEVRVADLSDRTALTEACAAADALLLCSGHGPDLLEHQRNAVHAARAAGVRRVVKISASPASLFPGTPSEAAAAHMTIEEELAASGVEAICVRPNAFAQLILGHAAAIARGELALPLGDAAVSWVDAADVGAVAAAALTAAEPPPATLEVTGPEPLDGAAVAAALTARVGHEVRYVALDDDEQRRRLEAAGAPGWLVAHVITIFRVLREHGGDRVTDTVQRLTGRPAATLEDVLDRELARPAVEVRA